MKNLQLFKNGVEILGSDGVMKVPQRTTPLQAILIAKGRNERYKKNFPHLVADEVGLYQNKIGSEIILKVKI